MPVLESVNEVLVRSVLAIAVDWQHNITIRHGVVMVVLDPDLHLSLGMRQYAWKVSTHTSKVG